MRDNVGSAASSLPTATAASSNVVRLEPMPEPYHRTRPVFSRKDVVLGQVLHPPHESTQPAGNTALLVDGNLAQIHQVTFSADSSTRVAAIGNGTRMAAVSGPSPAAGVGTELQSP